MAYVHIETIPLTDKTFQFIQTFVNREENKQERVFTETHDDRMIAAIVNCGMACRWLVDLDIIGGAVMIVSDTDGKDTRYDGEHNSLFKVIHDRQTYRMNRVKWSIIYGRYARYLDRIRELADKYNINFTQEIPYTAGEFLQEKIAEHYQQKAERMQLTRMNCIKLDVSGAVSVVKCNVCLQSLEFPQTNEFVPMRIDYRHNQIFTGETSNDKMVLLVKKPKELVKNFLEFHFGKHQRGEV